jgi:hypothetical protein
MLASVVLAVVHKVPKDGEGVKSGPIGLAVILVLCIAVYFLFKSMSKHLKKVREEFPTDAAPAQKPPVASGDLPQRGADVSAGDAPGSKAPGSEAPGSEAPGSEAPGSEAKADSA